MRSTLESVAGSVPALDERPQDFDEQIRLAKEERAERTMAPLRARPEAAAREQTIDGSPCA